MPPSCQTSTRSFPRVCIAASAARARAAESPVPASKSPTIAVMAQCYLWRSFCARVIVLLQVRLPCPAPLSHFELEEREASEDRVDRWRTSAVYQSLTGESRPEAGGTS